MSVASFSQLPEELQSMILRRFAENDVKSALLAREVSTTFRRIINDELIKHISLRTLIGSNVQAQRSEKNPLRRRKTTWMHLEENMFKFLQYRVRGLPKRLVNGELPFGIPGTYPREKLLSMLGSVLKRLTEFAPPSPELPKVQDQYMDDLLRIIAYRYSQSRIQLSESVAGELEIRPFPGFAPSHWITTLNRRFLVAGAAVGSISAFKAFPITRGDLEEHEHILGNGLVAATINNKTDIMRCYLNHLDSPKTNGPQFSVKRRIAFICSGALPTALRRTQIEAAKLLIDYIVKHNAASRIREHVRGWYIDAEISSVEVTYLVQMPMVQGCIELFEYVHQRLPELQSTAHYVDIFAAGFVEACKMGHEEFVRHIVRTGGANLFNNKGAYKKIPLDPGFDEYVDHPVLAAAAYNRVSILNILFAETAWDTGFPGLLGAAVFGLGEGEDYTKFYDKSGCRYPVTNFLFETGLKTNRSTIRITNNYARHLHFHAPKSITGDASMTFLLLVSALKKNYKRHELRMHLWVSVKKVLQLIVQLEPDMRYNNAHTANVLLEWILT